MSLATVHFRAPLGLLALVVWACAGCEAPDPVASSGGQKVEVAPEADAPRPPAAVLLQVGPRTVQRVELTIGGEVPSADPPVILGRPIVAAAAAESGVLAASLERADGRFVLERRTLEGTGARTVTPLDRIHGDGPTAVLAQEGGGVVLGTASEIRYLEPGEGGVALGVHRLPQPRPVRVLAEVGDELWAFDDASTPGLIHRFAAGARSLPRFLATYRLSANGTHQVLGTEERALLLTGAGTGREIVELDLACVSEGDTDCITHRGALPATGVDASVDRMAWAEDGLWLAAGAGGLLHTAWPPEPPETPGLATPLTPTSHDLGRPVFDVATWGESTLVVLGAPDAVAWLEGADDGISAGAEAPIGGRGTLLRPGSVR